MINIFYFLFVNNVPSRILICFVWPTSALNIPLLMEISSRSCSSVLTSNWKGACLACISAQYGYIHLAVKTQQCRGISCVPGLLLLRPQGAWVSTRMPGIAQMHTDRRSVWWDDDFLYTVHLTSYNASVSWSQIHRSLSNSVRLQMPLASLSLHTLFPAKNKLSPSCSG